ncbi:MAG TPA: FtsX-like permease family protein, partial [Solirubrobacteraceae bacterium]|nr:FtsX-like permease family protein [Solirubrobacteraceae bacterium]
MTGAQAQPQRLRTRRLLRGSALVYFYRRRLRAHAVQELLAGVGIAAAVALVLATGIAQTSIAGSTRQVLRAVIGPADLQLRARGSEGFPEAMLGRVESLRGVHRAAPLLERSVRITGPHGRSQSVYIAGTDVSLGVLNGLGSALPLGALTPGTIALSASSGHALGLSRSIGSRTDVSLDLGGIEHRVRVSALLDSTTVGALAGAAVAVMPLSEMQALSAQSGRVTRILVQSAQGRHALVAMELRALAGNRLTVAGSEQDVALLRQALRPSAQASTLFAIIGALLGMLLAFNAIMLTVPERRQAIADLRLSGTRRSAIVQLALFQGLCLGIGSTAAGLGVGYVLSRWVFHQSTSYLAEAFALAGGTVIPASIVLATALAGVIVTLLATMVPLLDLRSGHARDAVYEREPDPGSLFAGATRKLLLALTLLLLAATSILYATWPAGALAASVALALATVLAVPVTFAAAMRAAHAFSERAPRLATLAIALSGVRGTSIRSIALAATGAVALFGSVALGGARSNLLAGIHSFASAYAADAPIWVSEPRDNQATGEVLPANLASTIAREPGIRSVSAFDGAFL